MLLTTPQNPHARVVNAHSAQVASILHALSQETP